VVQSLSLRNILAFVFASGWGLLASSVPVSVLALAR